MAELGSTNIYGDLDIKSNKIKQVSQINNVTEAELNHLSGTTSSIQTQLNSKGTSNLALGTSSATAYRGDYGNTAYTHSQSAHAPSNAQANQTLTSGNGMAAWTATSGNLTIALGTPSTVTNATTNSLTTTGHTHALTLTKTDITGLGIPAQDTVYTLPVASTTIGGVKSGTDITVDTSGNVSVNDNSHSHTIGNVGGLQTALDDKVNNSQVLTNVPSGAKFTDTVYTHPTGAGNNHIPTGGASNQILRYSASGVAVWSAEKNTTYNVATTSANGLMSSTDKTKLNGIETGATADMTASEILTALKTVDGSGSGLEAEMSRHLIGDDTRSVDSAPDVYMSSGARYVGYAGWQTEFKSISTIGVSAFLTGSYCYLQTLNPWSDSSGGYPIQVAYGNGFPCWRVGTSGTTWSAWSKVNDGGNANTVTGFTVGKSVPSNAVFTDTVYTHPATSGNKHIPSGGASNQILRYSASGVAVWSNETNTTYGVATTSANGLMSGTDKTKLNGIETGANKYILPPASATTIGGVKAGTNITIATDGTINANDNPSSFITRQEKFIATEGQTVFTLTKGTYTPNSNRMFWYWNRVKQTNDAMTEQSSTTVKFPASTISAGDEILLEYYQVLNSDLYNFHASEHLTGGNDAIPVVTTSVDGLMSSTDKTKLNGIATGANKYTHPSSHPPSIITQDSSNRFVTDAEKTAWNAKGSSNLALGTSSTTAYRGDYGNTAYTHSQATHAPTGAQANQTITSGNGMATWTATSGNLTIAMGTPSTVTNATTNSVTSTSHTHALTLTKADITGLGIPAQDTVYNLPVAGTSIGGVKSGTDITVDTSGNVSVTDDSHNHIISNVDGLQTALNSKQASLGFTPANKAGDTFTGNVTVANTSPSFTVKNTSGIDAEIVLDRNSNANWKLLNSAGNLSFQSDYTTVKGDYYNALTLNYNSGNATFKGAVTAPTFSGALSGNATSASKLATTRTINGVGFNGSANITITANPNAHTHTIANVSGLQTAIDGKADSSQVLTNVPSGAKFTDTVYTLPVAGTSIGGVKSGTDITVDTSGNVSVKDDSHNHIISNVDGLQTALDSKVPTTRTINSKTLSGNINLTASDVGASAVVNLTVSTAVGTAAKTTVESFTPSENTLYLVRFVNGNTVSTPTLNGINIRLGVSNASTTTMSISGNIVVPMIYDATNNKFQITGSYRTSDTSETYTVRWNAAVKAGTQVTRYKLLTQGIDGKYYPTTIGDTTASTKTISTVPFLIGSPIIFYLYTTTIAANGLTSTSYNYTGVTTSTTTYAWNQNSGWRANEDVYLKGTVSGALFTLDNTTLTSHMTQDLPTTEDGFYYMRLGMFTTSTTSFKLSLQHPVFYYTNNELQSLNTSNGVSWEDILGRPAALDATTSSFTTALKTKLDGVSTGANKVLNSATNGNITVDGTQQVVYTHPTTAGNKHIPSGGASNQILRYSASGTAVWSAEVNTTYGVATTSANGLMSSADKTKLNGVSTGANKVLNSTTNGNITVDGVQQTVYTHPTGTNPHGTTKSDVGLGNVPNETRATTLASAALTGTPTAPTATAGTNTTQIATTAFVQTAVSGVSGGGGGGTTIKLSSTQPTGQNIGDLWFQII